jgi:hypothetical protein
MAGAKPSRARAVLAPLLKLAVSVALIWILLSPDRRRNASYCGTDRGPVLAGDVDPHLPDDDPGERLALGGTPERSAHSDAVPHADVVVSGRYILQQLSTE